MDYSIDTTEVENTDTMEAVEFEEDIYSDDELEEQFIESLDESGPVDVGGLTFDVSQIWKEMDPTAYRCGLSDWESNNQETETKYKCPICDGEYDDEDEAKFCCQDEEITKFLIVDEDGDQAIDDLFDTEDEAQEYIENNLEI